MASRRQGFTLIELIIVVIIIGILAAISGPIMSGMKTKAICAEAVTTMGTIRTALKAYYVEFNDWPPIPDASPWVAWMDPEDFKRWLPGLNIDNLTGTYFGKECYYINPPLEIACFMDPKQMAGYQNSADPDDKKGIKYMGDFPHFLSYLKMYIGNGKIFQYYVSKSGYPSE